MKDFSNADYAYLSPYLKKQLSSLNTVDQSTYLWIKFALSSYILKSLGDAQEMAHTVEGRVPFLDTKIFELSKTIPDEFKYRDMVEKYILRESMKGYLPDQIINRPKHPLLSPPMSMSKSHDFTEFFLSVLDTNQVSFLNNKKIKQFILELETKPIQIKQSVEPSLMMILSVLLFQREFQIRS